VDSSHCSWSQSELIGEAGVRHTSSLCQTDARSRLLLRKSFKNPGSIAIDREPRCRGSMLIDPRGGVTYMQRIYHSWSYKVALNPLEGRALFSGAPLLGR
jgi:hypothetical protein